ncbi:MAG TPA: hypothetical protein DEB31_01240, partial [Clostridiales bacterium]|nr:hypothetical protein [Clostridiales bacterium]
MNTQNDKEQALLDRAFQTIANEYAEQYGDELKREFEMLERNSPPQVTPRLDAKVRAKIAARKKTNYRVIGLIAACLLVVAVVPAIYGLFSGQNIPAAEAPAMEAPAMEAQTDAPVFGLSPNEEAPAATQAPAEDA